MSGSNSAAIIISAVILSLSVLGGSYMVVSSLDSTTEEIASFQIALTGLASQINAPSKPTRPARRRGPDPARVYKLNTEGSPAKGPKDARVTIVEFSDFQCPYCGKVTSTLAEVTKQYPDDVRVVFKHLPLTGLHPKAPMAHASAAAAGIQGKFWEMHDKIFANQRSLSEENILVWAAELDLDLDKFKKDRNDPKVQAAVERDTQEASSLGVSGTPAFFLNGRYFSGAVPLKEFKRRIEEELKG